MFHLIISGASVIRPRECDKFLVFCFFVFLVGLAVTKSKDIPGSRSTKFNKSTCTDKATLSHSFSN